MRRGEIYAAPFVCVLGGAERFSRRAYCVVVNVRAWQPLLRSTVQCGWKGSNSGWLNWKKLVLDGDKGQRKLLASFPFTNTMYIPKYMLLFSDYHRNREASFWHEYIIFDSSLGETHFQSQFLRGGVFPSFNAQVGGRLLHPPPPETMSASLICLWKSNINQRIYVTKKSPPPAPLRPNFDLHTSPLLEKIWGGIGRVKIIL